MTQTTTDKNRQNGICTSKKNGGDLGAITPFGKENHNKNFNEHGLETHSCRFLLGLFGSLYIAQMSVFREIDERSTLTAIDWGREYNEILAQMTHSGFLAQFILCIIVLRTTPLGNGTAEHTFPPSCSCFRWSSWRRKQWTRHNEDDFIILIQERKQRRWWPLWGSERGGGGPRSRRDPSSRRGQQWKHSTQPIYES